LALGENSPIIKDKRNATVQSISGTGALRIGAEFLVSFQIWISLHSVFQNKWFPASKQIYQPTPTWGNHVPIFKFAGLEVKQYKYYDKKTCGFDEAGCFQDIANVGSKCFKSFLFFVLDPKEIDHPASCLRS
jgi:aspartate aminotransferase